MKAPFQPEIREVPDTIIPFAAPSSTDDDSQHESLSSLTLGSGVSRPRRRQTANFSHSKRKHWRRYESDSAEPSRGYCSGNRRRGMNSSHSLLNSISNSSDPQSLPSLRVIASELFLICSLYCRYVLLSLRKPCRRFKRTFLLVVFSSIAISVFLMFWLFLNFYKDAVRGKLQFEREKQEARLETSGFLVCSLLLLLLFFASENWIDSNNTTKKLVRDPWLHLYSTPFSLSLSLSVCVCVCVCLFVCHKRQLFNYGRLLRRPCCIAIFIVSYYMKFLPILKSVHQMKAT